MSFSDKGNLASALAIILAICCAAGFACNKGKSPSFSAVTVEYHCKAGKKFSVVFHGRDSVVVMLGDGRSVSLTNALPPTGMAYTNRDETMGFWGRGEEVYFEEAGRPTFEECVARHSSLSSKKSELSGRATVE